MLNRLRTLWIISGWDVKSIEAAMNVYIKEINTNVGLKLKPLNPKGMEKKPAIIVDMSEPVDFDEPLNEN
jgi:hypothetical protein